MTEEKKVSKKLLLPEGWRASKIVGCSDEVLSKKGNKQFILRFKDKETGYEEDVYAVSEPKKRWFLKEILDACDVEHKDGVYVFEPPLSKNIIGKNVDVLIQHEDNEWINRDGVTVKGKQHRINEVRATELQAWDE